jgi:hypothetical protein
MCQKVLHVTDLTDEIRVCDEAISIPADIKNHALPNQIDAAKCGPEIREALVIT